MTLDPQIAGLIKTLDSGFPPVHTMTGAQARAASQPVRRQPQPEPVASVADHQVPVDNGRIDVRVYRPDASEPLPLLVYAHGGGFVFCDLDSHDGLCRNLANLIPAVVVSVAYRLAPSTAGRPAPKTSTPPPAGQSIMQPISAPTRHASSWAATAPEATSPR